MANDLVKRHWTTCPAILEWVDRVGDGRRQTLRDMCLRAIEVGGHDNSPAARRLGESLIRAGAGGFEIDYPVEAADGFLFIDYAWPKTMVGLEYNGRRDHGTSLAYLDDTRRRNRVVALGWRMLDARWGIADEDIVGWVLAALRAAS